MSEDFTEINMDVVNRWEATGLLDNLPLWEKEELAIIYDNTVRMTLSNQAMDKIPKGIMEFFEMVNLPVVRRLYRRVGPNFDLDNMLSELLDSVNKEKDFLSGETTPESNPVVEFSVNFADNYSDKLTSTGQLTDDEYKEQVDKMLGYVRDVLLNDGLVSNVDKSDDEWVLKISKSKKSTQITRFWNQKLGRELLQFSLSDINKGLK